MMGKGKERGKPIPLQNPLEDIIYIVAHLDNMHTYLYILKKSQLSVLGLARTKCSNIYFWIRLKY